MINHLTTQTNRQICIATEQVHPTKVEPTSVVTKPITKPVTSMKSATLEVESSKVKTTTRHLISTQQDQTTDQTQSWIAKFSDVITDIDDLLAILELSDLKPTLYLPKGFNLRVPKDFVAKMRKGDADDPLLKQVLPDKREQIPVMGYVSDPLAEQQHNPLKGLLHKYHSRVLVTVTGACAIHCRYCFRQHFDYQANLPKSDQIETIQSYIKAHADIREVILSGGDPLSVSNRRLFLCLEAIEALPQVTTIRLHTRLPIVIPERLDHELLQRLQRSRCQIVMVVHCNHANEIDEHTATYLQHAKQHNITLLNQAVLLAGVNDSLQAQVKLSERLFNAGVLPYYLHLLDKVAGAAHFDISKSKAIELYWQMLANLPGYLMPKLVQELPHKPFKTPVDLYAND